MSVQNLLNPDGSYTATELLFRDLTANEVKEYQQWSRNKYIAGEQVSMAWHPVVRAECITMSQEVSAEAAGFMPEEPLSHNPWCPACKLCNALVVRDEKLT